MLGGPGLTNQSLIPEITVEGIEHIRKFGGKLWFVSAIGGDDTNNGESPFTAFATIQTAIDAAAAGDGITIMAGDYDEPVDVDKAGIELWFEIGATLANTTPGTPLTVSANYVRICGPLVVGPSAGETGVDVTGSHAIIDNVRVTGGAVGFDISGSGHQLTSCGSNGATTTAYDITGSRILLVGCRAAGDLGATRGFYVNGGADYIRMRWCESSGHGTAGYDIGIGSTYCVIHLCISGAGDGERVDLGEFNMWGSFDERLDEEHHEEIYPESDGEGTAGDSITISNSTTDDAAGTRDDQNYWGDVAVVIPHGTLTAPWWTLGVYISANTATDIQQFQALYTDDRFVASQDGGNDWDKNETALTVDDGSIFEADDLVWVVGNDRAAGEIQRVVSSVANVVTIVSETRASGGLGLRYDYDTDDSANKMYLVYRETDKRVHPINGEYSAGSAKDHSRYVWSQRKRVRANGAMLMRMLNATDDAASTFDVRAIYTE